MAKTSKPARMEVEALQIHSLNQMSNSSQKSSGSQSCWTLQSIQMLSQMIPLSAHRLHQVLHLFQGKAHGRIVTIASVAMM
jgi:hypothetical protein